MFCTHVICAYSATCAELWLIVFRYLRSGATVCGPRERRNVHNDISGTFQMALHVIVLVYVGRSMVAVRDVMQGGNFFLHCIASKQQRN